ncbi:MAG: sigma-70 family RNA polymerase sigma factor [Bacteroidetes bacterium]|nr:sigma-70 family RNA polymerase sigma factor [Bacteroidota bacterium]
MRHQFLNVRNEVLLDAASAAVERCITSDFLQHDRSSGEIFRWLRTATVYEVLREFRMARRYARPEAMESLPAEHRADGGAAQHVLRAWLLRTFGASTAETLWLHMIEGCPPRDIAAIQQLGVTSIKARITRARKIMRRFSDTLG